MALINNIENIASIEYDGQTINSLPAATLLLLPPLIVKTVDKAVARVGDELTYTIVITNLNLQEITNLPFSDEIPAGTEYIEDSLTLNGVEVEGNLVAGVLTYTIPTIEEVGIASLTFQVTVIGGEE